MTIVVKYPDGRRIVVDNRNKKTEYNKQGNVVVRRYKAPKNLKKKSAQNKKLVSKQELTGAGRRLANRVETAERIAKKYNANREAATKAVLKSLEASGKRVAEKKAREMATREAVLRTVDPGRRFARIRGSLSAQQQLKRLERAPITEEYREALRSKVRSFRPKNVVVPLSRFGTVTVQGLTFAPQSQREKNYLNNLKKTLARDKKLKQDFDETLRSFNLTVKDGDKWYVRGYKGVGQAGVGLLFSGGFLANAAEKLVATVAGVGAGKRVRQEVGREQVSAAKQTPKAVWQGLDPTKPENWANIILVATMVVSKGANLKQGKKPVGNSKVTANNMAKNLNKKNVLSKLRAAIESGSKKRLSNYRRTLITRMRKLRDKLSKTDTLTKRKQSLSKKLKRLERSEKQQAKTIKKLSKKAKLDEKKLVRSELKARRQLADRESLKALKAAKARGRTVREQARTIQRLRKKAGLKKNSLADEELKIRRKLAKAEYQSALKKAKAAGLSTKNARKIANKIIKLRGRASVKAKKLERLILKNKRLEARAAGKKALLAAKARGRRAKTASKDSKLQAKKLRRLQRKARLDTKKLTKAELRARRKASNKAYKIAYKQARSRGLSVKKANALAKKLAKLRGKSRFDVKKLTRAELRARRKAFAAESKKSLKAAKARGRATKKQAKTIQRLRKKARVDEKKILKSIQKDLKTRQDIKRLEALIAKKQGRKILILTPNKNKVASINPPTQQKVGLAVNSNNGGQLILVPPTAKNLPVKAVAVKPTTISKSKAYYAALLKISRDEKSLSKIPSRLKTFTGDFFSIFNEGVVPASLRVPKSVTKRRVSIKGLDKKKLSSANEKTLSRVVISAVDAAVKSLSKTASAQARVIKLESLLERILRRLRRGRKKRLRIPKLKRKKKLTKKERELLDEAYTGVKQKYRPSLSAILFGIYGYKPKIITGLEIRPLLRRRRRKSKKK